MHVNLGIVHSLTRAVLVLILVAVLIAIGIWYLPVIKQNEKMRRDILVLNAEIEKEEATRQKLHSDFDAVTRDPRTIERLARQNLGYSRQGETIVRFESPQTNRFNRRP